jgi:hypothetical protein
MFAEMIEAADRAPSRRALYVAVLLTLMFSIILIRAREFLPANPAIAHSDFDVFHIAGKMVWSGDIAKAYDGPSFVAREKALLGTSAKIAWAYPPPYNLLVAPLGLVSLPLGFLMFMTASLGAYLWTLSRLATARFATMLVLLLIPVYVVVIVGQNGFLTGTLVGLACLGLRDRRAWAGMPLGLMIIKPHLVVGLALYVVISRQWRAFWVAAATVAIVCGLATLAFGADIWPAFLGGVEQSSALLESGRYPTFRMLSSFAALRSNGAPASVGFTVQAITAALSLACIVRAHRQLPGHQALGVAVVASLLITPYVYDYDIPVLGIGIALLLPDLIARGRPAERGWFYAGFVFMAAYGFVRLVMINLSPLPPDAPWPPTFAGLVLLISLGLVWQILHRPLGVAGSGQGD